MRELYLLQDGNSEPLETVGEGRLSATLEPVSRGCQQILAPPGQKAEVSAYQKMHMF